MNSKKILVIDDDELSRSITRRILDNAGYQVTDLDSASKALETAHSISPHVLVLDLVMPKHSGFTLLERWRATPALASIPVLVFSGLRDRMSVVKAAGLGADDYLTKPLDARLLLQKVAKLVKEHRFGSVTFREGSRPVIQARIQGRILQGNEAGFLLEAPVKIAPRGNAGISSPILDEIGCTTSVFRKTDSPARSGFPGQYLNDIAALGLNPVAVERIRRIIRGWI